MNIEGPDKGVRFWLPPRYQNAERSGLLAYIGWRDVSSASMSEERLRELASSLHVDTAMMALSAISTILDNTHYDLNNLPEIRSQQQVLAKQICAPEIADAIGARLAVGRFTVFVHDEQILIAAKLIALHAQPGAGDDSGPALSELLLGISDMMGQASESYTDPSDIEIALALRHETVDRPDQPRYLLARYFDLLITRAKSYSGPKKILDLDADMHVATGLSIEEQMAFGFMYTIPFYNRSSVADLLASDFCNIVRQHEMQISNSDQRDCCKQVFTQDRASLQAAIADSGQSVIGGGYLCFKIHPLYRLENGSAVPLRLSFVLEKASAGPYWALHTYYFETGGISRLKEYVGFIGVLFQDYLSELLSRTYPTTSHGARFVPEAQITAGPARRSSSGAPPDGVIVDGENLIILEMYAGAIPLKTMVKADPGEYRAGALEHRRKIEKQLCRAIKEIASGVWIVPGLDLTKVRHIYPVLALLQPFPQRPSTWESLLAGFKLDVSLASAHIPGTHADIPFGTSAVSARVHMPQILTAEEFEILEPLVCAGSIQLSALLNRKITDSNTRYISVKNRLFGSEQIQEQPNLSMLQLYNTAVDSLLQVLSAQLDMPVT